MTWTLTLETFCPGGDTDICKFTKVSSFVCSTWQEKADKSLNNAEFVELARLTRDLISFCSLSLKNYGEKLIECADDPAQFTSDSSTIISTVFSLKRASAYSIELNEAQFNRFQEAIEQFNAFAVLIKRSTTCVEYKFGKVSKLHFVKKTID